MNITKEDYAKVVLLLKHAALPGLGAVGREAAALTAKFEHKVKELEAIEAADAAPVEAEVASETSSEATGAQL